MTFADKVSSVRIILIPIFVSLLIYAGRYPILKNVALAVFILAVLSDFLDGLVARIRKEKSDIGQIIDPLADKLLLIISFVSLYLLRYSLPLRFQMPLGIVLVVVGRDLVVMSGLLVLHLLKKEVSIAPSMWGKLTTFFQMLTILTLLLNFFLFKWVWVVATVFTLISGLDYFVRGVRASGDSGNTNNVAD